MEITKLPECLYALIETTPDYESDLSESRKFKVRITPELILRINEIIILLNLLSKSKIIRSAIALEEGTMEEKNNGGP